MDDDTAFLTELCKALPRATQVVTACSEQEFRSKYAPYCFDLAVIDLRLRTGKEGLDVLREIFRTDPLQPVMVATGYADAATQIEVVDAGALMCVDKHGIDVASLGVLVNSVIEQGKFRRAFVANCRVIERLGAMDFVGTSEETRRLRLESERLARLPRAPVFVAGEFGSGREFFSRRVFARMRAGRTGIFSAVDAESLSEDSASMALFGDHSPGRPPRLGLLEETRNGALAIRNVEALSGYVLQVIKNTLHEGRFQPAGISASHPLETRLFLLGEDGVNLASMADRFDAAFIAIAPLRERREDISQLSVHLLETIRRRQSCPMALTPQLLEIFQRGSWPGNVTELRATLEFCGSPGRSSKSEGGGRMSSANFMGCAKIILCASLRKMRGAWKMWRRERFSISCEGQLPQRRRPIKASCRQNWTYYPPR